MRELQRRINELQPYVKEFKFQDGFTVVMVEMPPKWVVLPSKTIGVEGAEAKKLFFSNMENIGVDDILDYIEEIIKYNQEEEMKATLLRAKMEELGVLFHNNSLEALKTLEFTLNVPTIESEPEEIKEDIEVADEESN